MTEIKIGKLTTEYRPEEYEYIEKLCHEYRSKRKVKNRLILDAAAEELTDKVLESVAHHTAPFYARLYNDTSLSDHEVDKQLIVYNSLSIVEVYYQMLILTCLLNPHWHPHQVAFDIGNMVEDAIGVGEKAKKGSSDVIIALKIQEYWEVIIKQVSPKGVLVYGINPLRKGFAKLLGWNQFYPNDLIE